MCYNAVARKIRKRRSSVRLHQRQQRDRARRNCARLVRPLKCHSINSQQTLLSPFALLHTQSVSCRHAQRNAFVSGGVPSDSFTICSRDKPRSVRFCAAYRQPVLTSVLLELISVIARLFEATPDDSEQHAGHHSSSSQESFMESKLTQNALLCGAG